MMNKDQKVLALYGQRKSEGLTALALVCGYAKLLLDGLFGDLTPDQRKLIENISQTAPKAIAVWCLLDIHSKIEINPPHNFYTWYQELRNEGLMPVVKIELCAELLLKMQGLTDEQNRIMDLIAHQCETMRECWWYPEYELNPDEEG